MRRRFEFEEGSSVSPANATNAFKERVVAVDKPKGIDVSDDLLHFLGLKVWSGFYDEDEILERALEAIDEEWFEDNDSLDEDTLSDMISKAMLKKEKVEKAWPSETDCDRLGKAFRELTLLGIVSVENAGYTMDEGWEDYRQAVDDSGWERDAVRGGCFYHGQDLERAVLGYGIDLAFGSTKGGDEADVAIGREIVEVIAKHGFSPTWNGTPEQRISFPINWQRRCGPIADTSPPDMHLLKA
jgi:hypothetical protein